MLSSRFQRINPYYKGIFTRDNFAVIFPLFFIFCGLLAAFHHSLWRDEMQGWLVAWRSDTLVSLWKNNAPSGHPILWSLLIYLVKDLTGSPLSMQLLHWFLGSTAIICFWKWSPFPNWQKILFIFGYFPFWEYFFVCRHYVLAELLTFVFCATYPFRKISYIPASLCIGLLANTHAFSWSLAFSASAILLFEWFSNPLHRIGYQSNRLWRFDLLLSLVITISFVSFAAFSLIQVREAVDVSPSLIDFRHLLRVIGRVLGGYILIIPNHERWLDLLVSFLVSIFLVTSTISFLSKSKSALLFFLSGFIFLFLFNYYLYLGVGSRHYGYYYLILIASIWISHYPNDFIVNKTNVISPFNNLVSKLSKIFPFLLTICLSIHFAAGLHRSIYDFHMPYSAAQSTAEYIQQKGWDDQPIFATRDVEVMTVSGYLDKDLYYPEINGWGSYTQWNNREPIDRGQTLNSISSFFLKNPDIQRALIVLSRGSALRDLDPGENRVYDNIRIVADKKFERSWVKPERFYLYWAENNRYSLVD